MIITTKQSGAAFLMFILFFTFSVTTMLFALNQSIFADVRDFSQLTRGKQAYVAAESLLEDVVYRQINGTFTLNTVELLTLNGATVSATSTYDSSDDEYRIVSEAEKNNVVRKSEVILAVGEGSSFSYGLQAGTGGITLSNNSDIIGNIYSNGPVYSSGSADVFGDLVSSGPSGLAKDVNVSGDVYANTIDLIDAVGDAYYNVQLGTNAQNPVGGTRYTPATNQPIVDLPISTTTIQEWKDAISTYGTTITAADPLCSSGTYTIDTSITIGYLKVECNVDIRKTGPSVTVTMDGPVWVAGNLSFTQGPIVRAAASLGRLSAQFIVDNPADRINSSRIEIRNATDFFGSGDSRSYIMLLSANESSKLGGVVRAIDVAQSTNGAVLVYAADGYINIGNNIDLREVTAHKIEVSNGSSVTYESGLASLLFTSGPGGGYVIESWKQIR